jgi:serine/threonine protein kinase
MNPGDDGGADDGPGDERKVGDPRSPKAGKPSASVPLPPAPRPPPRPSSTGLAPPPKPPAPPARPIPRPPTLSQPAQPAPKPSAAPTPSSPARTASSGPVKGGAAKGTSSIDLAPGDLFAGRYRIDKQVGRGGMGAVYLAEQEPLARKVAIKVLHGTADETTVARFQREARLIAQLQHPHIVGLIDFGEDDGRLFLAMEYIDGEALTALLKREAPLTPKRACEIALQVAEALAVAHDIQVVHRDVKPDNVMIIKTAAGQDFVKMLDFGVAKIKREGDQQNTIETKAGLIVGSLRYISPEQVESGDITPRTDIYSFGCILYEMLTGKRVFEYPSPADCAIAHLTEKPKPPTIDGRALSGPLVDLTMRCLEKKPGKRPADAREALKILMACREDPASLEPPKATAEPRKGSASRAMPNDEDQELTVHAVEGGLASAQHAATVELSAVRREDLSEPASRPVARPIARPTTETGQRARPDVELRRPTGPHGFAAGAGDGPTTTHVRGVQLEVPKKSRAWLWVMLGLVLAGGGVAVFLLTQGDKGAPSGPSDTTAASAADATNETRANDTTAGEATDTSGGAVGVEADAAGEVGPEVAPDVVEVAKIEGTRVVTNPEGAEVTRDKAVVCTTPCVVPWRVDEKPPLLRLTLKGHIDIDLQLVRGDHGTEQRFELRPNAAP